MATDATDATDKKIRHEERMRDFAATLNEKDRRRFAALEASERGHGGITYIASVLGCSTKTIERGIAELDSLQDDPAAGRVRREGAGRKKNRFRNAGRTEPDRMPRSSDRWRSR